MLNRLFGKKGAGRAGQTKADPLDRQMLDLVLGGARDLRRTLPKTDQHKLDEYLDSVRSVERRIAAIETRQKEAALEKAGVAFDQTPTPATRRPSRSRFPKGTSAASTCR